MLKTLSRTLSIGLSGLLALSVGTFSVGVVNAAETTAKRTPNVLHEMVPHVVLPETIQYNKTTKNSPGAGYTAPNSPYVGTYVAYPSYQVSPTAEFRSVGQAVYPVSTPLLPAPLPKELPAPAADEDADAKLALQEHEGRDEGRDIVLSDKVIEPIRLVSGAEDVIPVLPMPGGIVRQTAILCPQPPKPPAAWAFSSPFFKAASIPAGFGGQTGSIMHHSPKGSVQHLGFQPAIDPSTGAAIPQQGVPYGQPMMGYVPEQNVGVQTQILPNGMILLTMPPDHNQCGLIRCRSGHAPRTMLLPPAGYMPQMQPGMTPQIVPQNVTMSNGFGVPYMSAASQQLPMQMPMQMMPQVMPMQTVLVTAMTPMGPAIVGYQQVPMMNPMMSPMMNPQLPQLQQIPMTQVPMAMATPNPMILSQVSAGAEDIGNDTAQAQAAGTDPVAENQMALVATPYGYAIQVPADALQTDMAAQLAQMQQALMQSQMQMPMQMPANPYAGLYVTPFGYIAMNQAAGQFGGFGQNMMMNVGYPMAGMPGQFMPSQFMPQQGGMSVSDMLQIMSFINSNKPQQRRARMAERLSERRENRKASGNDPFTQLMEAWSTPYVTPDTTLRMPARNAYPYGYFGVQASPTDTANYGGYHNLYMGNTTYPGVY